MKAQDAFRVNTLIIGAGRSGTTTLWSYLKEHRDVCFSYIKEVPFFSLAEHYGKGEKYFHSFFKKGRDAPVVATSDTYLLMDHDSIPRIHAYNPDMKIIVMLREPVSRAYSSYNYSVNFGHHPVYASFLDSMLAEKGIRDVSDIVERNNLGHFYGSLYYEHLSKWATYFSRENILLLKTSVLRDDPGEFSRELFSFLNLSEHTAEIEKVNAAAVPKNKSLEKLFMDRNSFTRKLVRRFIPRPVKNLIMRSGIIDKVQDANRKEQSPSPLSMEERKMATPYFSEDLMRLKTDFNIEF